MAQDTRTLPRKPFGGPTSTLRGVWAQGLGQLGSSAGNTGKSPRVLAPADLRESRAYRPMLPNIFQSSSDGPAGGWSERAKEHRLGRQAAMLVSPFRSIPPFLQYNPSPVEEKPREKEHLMRFPHLNAAGAEEQLSWPQAPGRMDAQYLGQYPQHLVGKRGSTRL